MLNNLHIKTSLIQAFRYQARAVFLTYPQCDLTKEHALTLLRTLLGEAEGTHYLIGRERHQDGHYHLHVFVERTRMIETTRPSYFDLETVDPATGGIKVFHPNITSPRDRAAVKSYITKEDTEPLHWPQDWSWSAPAEKKSKWSEATPLLLEGKSPVDLLKLMPEFVLANLQRVEQAAKFVANVTAQANVPPLEEFLGWDLPPEFASTQVEPFHSIWNELKGNLANMEFGRRQLFLHGATGIGKSTFLQHLMLVVRTYLIPTEDFYDMWDNGLYDLSVLEEFKGQKPIQWLNQWLDGAQLNLRKKGSQALKTRAVPTLILSNFSPLGSDIYPNMQENVSIQTFRRRLKVFEVDLQTMRGLTQALRIFLVSTGRSCPALPSPVTAPVPAPLPTTVNPLWHGDIPRPTIGQPISIDDSPVQID